MLAITSRQGSVEVVEREIPDGDGELIRVTSSGICGSDLHMLAMGLEGVILGHEFGGFTQDGRLVAVRPTGECGTCSSCVRQHFQTCQQAGSSLYGLSTHGGLAEYVRVDPARVYDMPQGVSPQSVGLVEPLAVVVHGINRVNITSGMTTLVVGAGSIGLLTAAVLRDRGAMVDIVARHEHQQDAALRLGVTPVSEPRNNYDVVFDAVCNQTTFDICVNAVRPGGLLLEFGMFWEPVTLSNTVMMKEISILPSMFYGHNEQHDDFREAIDFLSRQQSLAQTLVTHTFPLHEAQKAFATAQDKKSGAIKVHFSFDLN